MKFEQVLQEFSTNYNIPLKLWNLTQMTFWKKLVRDRIVEKDDMTAFMRFGEFFDNYYNENRKFPTYNKIKAELQRQERMFNKI